MKPSLFLTIFSLATNLVYGFSASPTPILATLRSNNNNDKMPPYSRFSGNNGLPMARSQPLDGDKRTHARTGRPLFQTADSVRGGAASSEASSVSVPLLLSSLYGAGGVVYILLKAVKRVVPIALEPFAEGGVPLTTFQLVYVYYRYMYICDSVCVWNAQVKGGSDGKAIVNHPCVGAARHGLFVSFLITSSLSLSLSVYCPLPSFSQLVLSFVVLSHFQLHTHTHTSHSVPTLQQSLGSHTSKATRASKPNSLPSSFPDPSHSVLPFHGPRSITICWHHSIRWAYFMPNANGSLLVGPSRSVSLVSSMRSRNCRIRGETLSMPALWLDSRGVH